MLSLRRAVNDWNHIICIKVNKNFAIKLVAEEPVTDIEARVVSCDGGGGALGHPKVYINLVKQQWFLNTPLCHSGLGLGLLDL